MIRGFGKVRRVLLSDACNSEDRKRGFARLVHPLNRKRRLVTVVNRCRSSVAKPIFTMPILSLIVPTLSPAMAKSALQVCDQLLSPHRYRWL